MPETPKLLLVDDDAAILRSYKNALGLRGFAIETASTGKEAVERLTGSPFDVVVSDITMPEMTGLEFLKHVREHDLDVPVILMTGEPGLDSAVRALEYGAFRYFVKPVDPQALADAALMAVRLHLMARLKREALELAGDESKALGDRASLEARFEAACRNLWMANQPIVSWGERRVHGYEALLRSAEPTLANPGEFLDVAERLGRLHDLGRRIRKQIAENASQAPEDAHLFVNLHAFDLNDEELFESSSGLVSIADRVVLEITERASLDSVKNVSSRIAKLRKLGFRIAVDDLGAGYAGLTSFAQLEPDIAKLDMSLVRGIDGHAKKQSIVRSMAQLCTELGITVVAEGVETAAERDTLVGLGCDLLQGYLFSRPEKGFPAPRF
jgi:EAL domain-containing protein (putative c-di-GMP-specific phosphodiesterase class I)/ActR/RegA family two-component response regulator